MPQWAAHYNPFNAFVVRPKKKRRTKRKGLAAVFIAKTHAAGLSSRSRSSRLHWQHFFSALQEKESKRETCSTANSHFGLITMREKKAGAEEQTDCTGPCLDMHAAERRAGKNVL
jgi:hypothetical protein